MFVDCLTIYDGEDSSAVSLGQFCGDPPNLQPDLPIVSTSNSMYISFKTGEDGQDRGFRAVFASIGIDR